jgi:hypothetical protein
MKGRRIAEKPATHKGRGSRRDGDRKEGLDAHLRHHELDGKHHAANGGIESGSDPRARARSDQSNSLACRHVNDLSQRRTERGSDLDDRAFAPNR